MEDSDSQAASSKGAGDAEASKSREDDDDEKVILTLVIYGKCMRVICFFFHIVLVLALCRGTF